MSVPIVAGGPEDRREGFVLPTGPSFFTYDVTAPISKGPKVRMADVKLVYPAVRESWRRRLSDTDTRLDCQLIIGSDWKPDTKLARGTRSEPIEVYLPDWHSYQPDQPPRYTSSEKVVLEVGELTVETVADFRALLKKVLDRAGLTCGQIAMKTSINRSSLYNLVDVRRSGLPTKPDQVQEFLCACGLQLQQVATIMRSWSLLNAARPKPTGKPAAATTPAAASTPITKLSPREIVREATALRGPRVGDFAIGDIGRELVRTRTLLPIVFCVAVLLGWRVAVHVMAGDRADVGVWTLLHMSSSWWLLTTIGLVVSTQVLRWRLRRSVRPRLKSRRGSS
ncbi:hypothetical protein [Amycolatopsis australiensis]|uniref:Uncharacterized protein n=1 Tax=Amycolatopsis australiensis TaxID=546364 RepID=A0A1K1LRT6_9PSEU|nr:hypothetical protein [Amycolatopsis australiensis]SFW13586.1 hypothetical protein SAMN04489730_0173 [Amycolatopsis australiensis]